jgi:hypothetical protein
MSVVMKQMPPEHSTPTSASFSATVSGEAIRLVHTVNIFYTAASETQEFWIFFRKV